MERGIILLEWNPGNCGYIGLPIGTIYQEEDTKAAVYHRLGYKRYPSKLSMRPLQCLRELGFMGRF